MVFCFVALGIFAVAGIFSARYRQFAKEAFSCAFRRITLRKCTTDFDNKMKMKISTSIAKKSPKAGNFIYKNFTLLSWILVIITLASLVYGVYGLYNFLAFGNCNGPNSDGTCIYSEIVTPECDCGAVGCNEEQYYGTCDYNCECVKERCRQA